MSSSHSRRSACATAAAIASAGSGWMGAGADIGGTIAERNSHVKRKMQSYILSHLNAPAVGRLHFAMNPPVGPTHLEGEVSTPPFDQV
jgi:hypothetical protein